MHSSTFEYLKPTDAQLARMDLARKASSAYATALQEILPEGPDKTYVLRLLRTTAMWCNVCITRTADGTPRSMGDDEPQQAA
jgi:hypothetical protein